MAPAVDVAKIQKAARTSLPLTIKTYKMNHETEEYLETILFHFLKEFGQQELTPQISYCMRELAVNANKANTKRVFFDEQKLDISNEKDYQEGMASFKEATLSNINYYLDKQKDAGLYIKIVFHASGESLKLLIKNNVKISRKEQMRVYDRIARSRAFSSLEEAMGAVLDSSEGAGLGLVILVLMLKKLGLDEESFDIDVEGEETVAQLVIPFSEVHKENLHVLSREIVQEIDELPQFPENIVQLQKMIDDPESEIADIAKHIAMDISLTADLLKLVNSAQFMLSKKVDNIAEAVKMVGLRGLKTLLYSYGTQKILKKALKEHWDHANRTAFYAYNLAKSYLSNRDILDDVYVGGILHDIGKIIFFNAHPVLLEKISTLCREREIDRDLFEDLSAGLNHAEIGALIAEKWNFPDQLIEAIKFHHEPHLASPEMTETVESIYLGNVIANLESDEIVFDQISKEVLKKFKIRTEDQLNIIKERLSEAFDRQNAEIE